MPINKVDTSIQQGVVTEAGNPQKSTLKDLNQYGEAFTNITCTGGTAEEALFFTNLGKLKVNDVFRVFYKLSKSAGVIGITINTKVGSSSSVLTNTTAHILGPSTTLRQLTTFADFYVFDKTTIRRITNDSFSAVLGVQTAAKLADITVSDVTLNDTYLSVSRSFASVGETCTVEYARVEKLPEYKHFF